MSQVDESFDNRLLMDHVPFNWDLENKAESIIREELGPKFKTYGSIVFPKISTHSLIIITIKECKF